MLPSPQPPPRSLHGFHLPPGWGRHKLLRCSKAPAAAARPDPPLPPPVDDDAFRELRSRLLTHYDVAGTPHPAPRADADADNPRPWNLRKRRAACGAPFDDKSPSPSPAEKAQAEGARRRMGTSIQLRTEEIEEDLARMCGGRSWRKPRRRGQKAQRVVDNLNPGECLCRMLEDWCRVPEERKKR